MTESEAVKLAVEGINLSAIRILETENNITAKFHIYMALGYISQTLEAINTRLETLESEKEND